MYSNFVVGLEDAVQATASVVPRYLGATLGNINAHCRSRFEGCKLVWLHVWSDWLFSCHWLIQLVKQMAIEASLYHVRCRAHQIGASRVISLTFAFLIDLLQFFRVRMNFPEVIISFSEDSARPSLLRMIVQLSISHSALFCLKIFFMDEGERLVLPFRVKCRQVSRLS